MFLKWDFVFVYEYESEHLITNCVQVWACMSKLTKRNELLCSKMLMFKNACLCESNDMHMSIKMGFK